MTRCEQCDELNQEVAELADMVAFWAFQAKWYYAAAHGLGRYDELPVGRQREIDKVFDQHRVAENRERYGHVAPAHDIGS